MDFEELISPESLIAYYVKSAASQTNYLGEGLFPRKKQVGLNIDMITGRAGLPVVLAASVFDANAPIRDRISIETTKTKMMFFRERMVIGEELRQNILLAKNNTVLEAYLKQIFDDTANLIKGARVVNERMAMQLLSSGKIKIEDNGVKKDYDFRLNKNQFVKPVVSWSDTENSTPIKDIKNWLKVAKGLGFKLTRAICSSDVWDNLMDNKSLRENMLVSTIVNKESIDISDADMRAFLKKKTGIDIVEYSEVYKEKLDGPAVPFLPNGTVTLIPDGPLGNSNFGTTPEEADLMTGKSSAKTSIVDTGVAVTNLIIPHPVNVQTIVSAVTLPSFNSIGGDIIIAKVG